MSEQIRERDPLSGQIVDSAFAVHSTLGPGLLESVYEQCIAYELEHRGITVQRQVALPVTYRDIRIDAGFRMDMILATVSLWKSRPRKSYCRFMTHSC